MGLNAANGVASQLTGTIGNTLSALLLGGFNGVKNMARSALGTGLTSTQKEANAWTAQREDTAYQRSVADMQAAGLNPALMYGSAGSTSPSASTSPSDGASLSDMLGSATTLSQIQSMEVQNKVSQKQVNIAQQNADTAKYNAETERMNVEQGISESKSREIRMGVQNALDQSQIKLNAATTEKVLNESDYLVKSIENLDDQMQQRAFERMISYLEYQCHAAKIEVDQGYLQLARDKWEQGERSQILADVALKASQATYYAAEAKYATIKGTNDSARLGLEFSESAKRQQLISAQIEDFKASVRFKDKQTEKLQNDMEIDSFNAVLEGAVYGTFDRLASFVPWYQPPQPYQTYTNKHTVTRDIFGRGGQKIGSETTTYHKPHVYNPNTDFHQKEW